MTDEQPQLTAQQVAEYDQAFASTHAYLTTLIAHWIVAKNLDAAAGVPPEVSVVHMSQSFLEEMPQEAAASVLATAIVLLGRMVEEADDERPDPAGDA